MLDMSICSVLAEMAKAETSNHYTDVVATSNGHVYIDTTYTLDHGWETMVFPCNADGEVTDWGDLDVERYDSEEEARVGHDEMVAKWKGR